jgi:hypothetical protein
MHKSLLELFQLGGRKNYEFHFKIIEDKSNVISLDNENKIITANIGDPDDENLTGLIEDVKKQLQ